MPIQAPPLIFGRLTDPYPGTGFVVSKGEYESFRAALRAMEIKLKHDKHTLGRFSPTAGITLPAAYPAIIQERRLRSPVGSRAVTIGQVLSPPAPHAPKPWVTVIRWKRGA